MKRGPTCTGNAATPAIHKGDHMTTYTLKDLWNLACKHDNIEPSSKFVVFSTENPWAKKYNTLLYLRAQSRG
jgi:hypothetical protein